MSQSSTPAVTDAIYDASSLGRPRMFVLGFQHMFAMFGATVLVPVLTGLSVSATLLFAGIGTLLSEGIGDTIRVSLTADPVEEVRAGIAILKAAGLRREGVRFVSCPTCGRTQIDLIALAQEVEQRLQGLEREITVAVMGCVVNGPGEAHEADYGIAGGKDCGLLFRRGEILGKYPADKLADALVDLILSEK